jgi:hypothetical protein
MKCLRSFAGPLGSVETRLGGSGKDRPLPSWPVSPTRGTTPKFLGSGTEEGLRSGERFLAMTALNATSSCRRCGQVKPQTEFWANRSVSTGLSPWCKDCARAAARRSRAKHGARYNLARRKPRRKRDCPVCGQTFETAIPHKLYCSRRCKKRRENVANRGGELNAPLPEPFKCANCEKRCIPGENVAAHATKFCGRKCKSDWHHEQERNNK